MTRYEGRPSMGLRPAPVVFPRSQANGENGVQPGYGCLEMVASFVVFAALVALVIVAMGVLA